MKKYCSFFIILFSTPVLLSCKKSDPAKDNKYTASINDKTWWGKFTNAGEAAQHYCVHFNADKTLTWSQFSGNYQGVWSLEGNKITLTFTSPAVIVTADITDDNKFANITTNTPNKINNGEQGIPNIVLDNTVWKGTETSSSGVIQPLQFTFLPGYLVRVVYNNVTYAPVSYVLLTSNGSTRFSPVGSIYSFFGFNISGTEMRGTETSYKFTWQVTKQ